MKLETGQPQEVNTFGKVSMSHEGRRLEVPVRFVYAEDTHAGVDFIYLSAANQKSMASLVESLAAPGAARAHTV